MKETLKFILVIIWCAACTLAVVKHMDEKLERQDLGERVKVVEQVLFDASLWPAGVQIPDHVVIGE